MVSLKSEDIKDKIMKLNIVNNYVKIYSTNKDALSLAEDIAVKIYTLVSKNAFNKYKSDMFTAKLLSDVCNTSDFLEIKDRVAELQVIKH